MKLQDYLTEKQRRELRAKVNNAFKEHRNPIKVLNQHLTKDGENI